MDLQILQTKDETFEGHVLRYIFGLNLLPDGHPESRSRSDPRLVFLRETARQYNIGAVIDKDASHVSRLQFFLPEGHHEKVANSFLGGELIDAARFSDPNGIFIAKVAPELFDYEEIESDGRYEAIMFHILYSDALALFVLPTSKDAPSRLSQLLSSTVASTAEFLRKALELYDIVITSHADGDFFGCYAKDTSKFQLLNSPLEMAVNKIKETSWFQESKNDLEWDGRWSMCLIEKDKIPD
jgi:hypothetical protein